MPRLAEFRVTTTDMDHVLVASGEIDLSTADEFRTALAELTGAPGRAVLDLSGVTFIDSSGLSVLAGLAADSTPVVLRAPSAVVRSILELTGLAPHFTAEPE